ncbi:MAG: hypothetical protein IJ157_09890, partial [Clostridia bacterium]|nr:hypothetical protein [Clostridia bacterium]
GTVTVLLQGFGRRSSFEQPAPLSEGEMVFYPVPDRLIYGFESPQALLWGEPLNGGVEVLPRLALAFYAILAVALCLVAGLLWFIFRKKPWSAILRQVFFAPVSYLAAHALILGRRTATFSLLRDFGGVLLLAAALYALLTLLWPVWLQHKKERSPKSAGDIR